MYPLPLPPATASPSLYIGNRKPSLHLRAVHATRANLARHGTPACTVYTTVGDIRLYSARAECRYALTARTRRLRFISPRGRSETTKSRVDSVEMLDACRGQCAGTRPATALTMRSRFAPPAPLRASPLRPTFSALLPLLLLPRGEGRIQWTTPRHTARHGEASGQAAPAG